MLDAGIECEPDRIEWVRQLAALEAAEWPVDAVDRLRGRTGASALPKARLPIKLAYGSAFAYAADEIRAMTQHGTNCVLSFAKGGLTNVWGAAVLPNAPADLAGWPISIDDLARHYDRVSDLMPIAGAHDELEGMFPFYGRAASPLRSSALASSLLARMRAHRQPLEDDGVFFGQSRLAVASDDDPQRACRYTGLCLSGCPYSAIWNAARAVDALRRHERFSYLSGWTLDRVESAADSAGVRLVARASDGVSRRSFDGRRAFLACGPVSTMRIVIDSLRAYGRTLSLHFQPYFLLPMVALRNSGDVETEPMHTLAQLFVELVDPTMSSRTIHLQLYTFNEFIRERVRRATGWLGPVAAPAARALQSRLLAVQGYLHSSETPPIRVTSAFDERLGRARLTLTAPADAGTRRIVQRTIAKLRRHARHIGAVPLASLKTIGLPGDGNHVGATFPMRRSPGELETDVTGQLRELSNVHLVDSSSLPDLAATTFTYTAMANAHRIADAVGRD
jgi:choline dehydrogenase-like flavoprotein